MRDLIGAEFQKTWSRKFIITAFVLLCVSQAFFASQNYDSGGKEYVRECNLLSSKMNDEWCSYIRAEYDRLWERSPSEIQNDYERYLSASFEQRAVLRAYNYTFFTDMIDEVAEAQAALYGDFATEAYADLRAASAEGRLEFGYAPAAEAMVNQRVVGWGVLIFMLMLCADIFSAEREREMYAVQTAAKQGRGKLFFAKLAVCQLSTLIVWAASEAVYAAALTTFYAWGNAKGVVQDFIFNACPYELNIGEYLAVVLFVGFAASQVCGLVIFLFARIAGSTLQSIALTGGVLILPYMLASMTDNVWLSMWFPCLMNGQWLWNGLHLLRIAGNYVHMWVVACIGMAAVAVICALILYKDFKRRGI